ncbi:MAG: tetratricopeptide repeat protein [Rhodospirillaceae bacterium]|nr:tetratricopeptide repeat protein [Rhodospirillaceae bacterium]MBT7234850.1 tetratricopeptide repeat protein [Rhodospirillaceae bacterium]
MMAEREVHRRLAAVLAADVASYTRLMEDDTDGTVAAWQDAREDVIKPQVAEHSGTIVKLTGDGFLVEFPTVQAAVNCALAMQAGLAANSLKFRIGVNLGDIVDDGEDIHGEGVNVAARLEGLAEPGGICISGMVYDSIRNRIDAHFEDMGLQEVKNVSAPVQAYAVRAAAAAKPAETDATASEQMAIAVLPFDNLSGDPDQEYFSDGLTEDIITALSHWHSFSVIARNSTFQYKGQSPDIRQVAANLGVQYVLEGSVRKSGERVRITAQLIDGATGGHVWADKFDRKMDDFFELQDELTQIIAAKVEPEFAKAEQKRIARKPPGSLDAWDNYQRAFASLDELTKEGNLRAQELFRRAIEIDPNDSRPHSGLAYCLFRYSYDGYSDSQGIANEESVGHARRAVALDDGDAQAHEILAILLIHSNQLDSGIVEARRAVDINPNMAHAYIPLGNSLSLAGRPADGIPHLETANRLNPDDVRVYMYLELLAEAHLNNRDYDQAVVWARKAIERKRDFVHSHIILASALGNRGDLAEAAMALAECRRLHQNFIDQFPTLNFYRNPADKDHILNGLRQAGWTEDTGSTKSVKPSIAVLPFDNLSGDPEQEYFSDGITEDIITALSRIRQFDVLARNSTFTYKGEAVDIEAVAKELGVAYVLEGSVRKAGNRVRITAQLIDGETGNHIWAEKYDRELEDIFAVQDEITLTVVGAIEPEMSRVERERAKAKAPENLDAWDMVLQGWAITWDVETHGKTDGLKRAQDLFEQAITLDGKQSRAYSGLATCMVLLLTLGLAEDREVAFRSGLEAGRRSIELDREDDLAHTTLGSLFVAANQPEQGLAELEMAIALSPSSSWARFWLGAANICNGQPDAGIASLNKAIGLSPREQFVGPAMAWLAHAYMAKEEFEAVVEWAEKALRNPVTQIWGNINLVSALGQLDRIGDAEIAIKEMLRRRPDMNIKKIDSMINILDPKYRSALLAGLRKAGVEEDE